MGRALLIAKYSLVTEDGEILDINVATSHFESLDFNSKAREAQMFDTMGQILKD
jgi:hypothetical protein